MHCVFLDLDWGFSHSSVGKESTCTAGDSGLIPGLGRSAGEGIGYPLQYSWASLVAHKESACLWGDLGSIPEVGKIPWRRKSYPLQYSGLENSMDCIVHGVAKSLTGLSDFRFHSVSRPEIKPMPDAAEAPNHWTNREFPESFFLILRVHSDFYI